MENGGNPLSDLGNLLDFKKIGNFLGLNQQRNNSNNQNPLKMLGNIFGGGNNRRRKYRSTVKVLPIEEAYRRIKSGNIFLLDVRTEMEHKCIRIKGSVNIPLDRLQFEIQNVVSNRQETILIYCSTGSRVRRAIQILSNLGYDNLYIWEGAGLNTFAFQDLIVYNDSYKSNGNNIAENKDIDTKVQSNNDETNDYQEIRQEKTYDGS